MTRVPAEASGLAAAATDLLDRHVHGFEHLEALLLLSRGPPREWTVAEIAEALDSADDFTQALEALAEAQLVLVRRHAGMPTYSYAPSTIELATAVKSLASSYQSNRSCVIRRMNANVIARLRAGAACVFAEAFVVGSPARVPVAASQWQRARVGLFLHVDGTLLDFAPRPDLVAAPTRLVNLLARLHALLGGALVLVSGRTATQLDTIFAPLHLPCAALHGGERRDSSGRMHAISSHYSRGLDTVRGWLAHNASRYRGLLVEDKGAAVAVHYRERPDLAGIVEAWLGEAQARLGNGFRVHKGAHVSELVPAVARTRGAIEAFLAEPTFAGKTPLFIGDDSSDADASSAVERRGGQAIVVGRRADVTTRLPHPPAVAEWLERLLRAQGRYA